MYCICNYIYITIYIVIYIYMYQVCIYNIYIEREIFYILYVYIISCVFTRCGWTKWSNWGPTLLDSSFVGSFGGSTHVNPDRGNGDEKPLILITLYKWYINGISITGFPIFHFIWVFFSEIYLCSTCFKIFWTHPNDTRCKWGSWDRQF